MAKITGPGGLSVPGPVIARKGYRVTDGRVRSTQTLVIHQWAGPSVITKLAPDSTPDRAE